MISSFGSLESTTSPSRVRKNALLSLRISIEQRRFHNLIGVAPGAARFEQLFRLFARSMGPSLLQHFQNSIDLYRPCAVREPGKFWRGPIVAKEDHARHANSWICRGAQHGTGREGGNQRRLRRHFHWRHFRTAARDRCTYFIYFRSRPPDLTRRSLASSLIRRVLLFPE